MKNRNLYVGRYHSKGTLYPSSTSFHLVRWHSPHPGIVKFNFDGSLCNSSVDGGFFLCDWAGRMLTVGAAFYITAFILVVEARALRDGLNVAIEASFHKLIIEWDNKIVVQALDRTIQIPWKIQCIINAVLSWRNLRILFTTKHIFQEVNMTAD